MNHRVAIFRLLGLHFQQEVTLKHLLYSKEKPVNHWLTGLVECKTNKDVCENPLFARLCGSAPLIFSFFRLGLGGFSAEGGF